ncbi:hypothetical protein MMC14_007445 [Varicellaria rhodocarpa]|nr:hypothetical protein [Varicellaria rhodocarpa]
MTAPSSLTTVRTPPTKAPETGYFRWPLRYIERNKSNRSSPQPSIGSSTPATPRSKRRRAQTRDFSPELSPLTLLANASIAGQLPPKPKERRRRSSSESSQGRLRFPDDVVGPPKRHASSHSGPTAEERKTPISQPSLDSIGSHRSSSKLSVTSLGDRVRKLYYGQPETLPARNTTEDVTSSQLTKLGHQWTRELSGRRFEIKISRKQPFVDRPPMSMTNKDVTEMTKKTAVNTRSKAIFLRKLIKREERKLETFDTNGSPTSSGRSVLKDEVAPNTIRKEGFFNRTRRLLGFKGVPSSLIVGSNGSDLTKEYLNRVSSALDMPMEEFDSLSRSSGTTDLSIAAVRPHKGPGLYTRHSTRSISSSLREAARGKTPFSTPNNSTDKKHPQGGILDHDPLTNIVSEARWIKTPSSDTSIENRPKSSRGNSVDGENLAKETPQSNKLVAAIADPKSDALASEVIDENVFKTKLIEGFKEPSFALNLPDHLASSALCPTNPKHSSKGKGFCIIHGRNREISNGVDKSPRLNN